MNKDYIKEQINHSRDIKNNLWTSFIVSIGGTLGLMLNPDNLFKKILIGIGLLLSSILISSYFTRYSRIEDLLSKLKKED